MQWSSAFAILKAHACFVLKLCRVCCCYGPWRRQAMRTKTAMEQASKAFQRASKALLAHGRSIPYQLWNNWGVVEHR